MRRFRLVLIAMLLLAPFAMTAMAQDVVEDVGVGPALVPAPVVYGPPVCAWGYYPYYPYACAPYGYYGPGWFYNGIFIGVGPWYGWGWGWRHGWHGWYGGYGYHGGYGVRGVATGRGAYAGGYRGNAVRGYSGNTRGYNSRTRGYSGGVRGGTSGGHVSSGHVGGFSGGGHGGGFSGGGSHGGGGHR